MQYSWTFLVILILHYCINAEIQATTVYFKTKIKFQVVDIDGDEEKLVR